MGLDLDKISDGTGDIMGGGPGKGFDSAKISDGSTGLSSGASAILGGRREALDFDDFRFQPKTNADNYKLRAQDQGFLESSAIRIGNALPNIAGMLAETVGGLGALATEWGDDRDYNNWLTEFGNSMKNPFGTVYREDPNKVWDLSDPAWWGDAFFGLVESAASFAATGAGIGSILGGIAKAAGAGRLAMGAARLGTAATLAYTEGAMSGARVFDQTYQTRYDILTKNGMDPDAAHEQAKKAASVAAATTVQLNTILNTGLNMTALIPLFKSNDDIMRWYQTAGRRQAGETFEQWSKRIQSLDSTSSDITKLLNPRANLITSYGSEALQEGTEEVVNVFAEARGEAQGKTGQTQRSLSELLSDLEHFFDDTMNSEGGLNFVLGAFGGVAQTAIIDNIPLHKVYTDASGKESAHAFDSEVTEDGKFKKRLVSSNYKNLVGGRTYFDNVKDKLVADINRTQELQTKLASAISSGNELEANQIKAQMFDVRALNAVQLGLGASFAEQFEQIQRIDNSKDLSEPLLERAAQLKQVVEANPEDQQAQQAYAGVLTQIQQLSGKTEAMQRGFAKSPDDNDYKRRAQQAINDIKEYDQLWKDISSKYSTGDEWHSRYADYLFNKEVHVRSWGKAIEDFRSHVQQQEAARDARLAIDDDTVEVSTLSDVLADNTAAKALKDDATNLQSAMKAFVGKDPAAKAAAEKLLRDLLGKYRPTADSEDDLLAAQMQTAKSIAERLERINKRIDERLRGLETSENFARWREKNPSKPLTDYLIHLRSRYAQDEQLMKDKAELVKAEEQHTIARKHLAEDRSSKGRQKYIKMAKKSHNALVKGLKAEIDRKNKAFTDDLYSQNAAKKLNDVQRKQYAETVRKQIEELKAKLAEVQKQYNEDAEFITGLTSNGLLNRLVHAKTIVAGRRKLNRLRDRINNIKDQIDYKESELAMLLDPTVSTEAALPTPPATPNPSNSTTPNPSTAPQASTPVVEDDPVEVFEEGQEPPFDPPVINLDAEVMAAVNALPIDDSVKAAILSHLDQLEQGMRNGYTDFSDDALQDWVDLMQITTDQAATVMQAFKKVYDTIVADEAEVQSGVEEIAQAHTQRTAAVEAVGATLTTPADVASPIDTTVAGTVIAAPISPVPLAADTTHDLPLIAGDTYEIDHGNGLTEQVVVTQVAKTGSYKLEHTGGKWHKSGTHPFLRNVSEEQRTPPVDSTPVEEQPDEEPEVTTNDLPEIPADTEYSENPPFTPDDYGEWDATPLRHEGFKALDGVKVNTLTHTYRETITNEGDDLVYDIYSNTFADPAEKLNPNVNPRYLVPGYLVEGDQILLVVDSEFDGNRNVANQFNAGEKLQEHDRFANYLDGESLATDDGRVAEVPIKLIDPRSGTTLGYLPRGSWITEQYPNTSGDYRNVVNIIRDEQGNVIESNNVQKQLNRIMAVRRRVVAVWNRGGKAGLPVNVLSRSAGHQQRVVTDRVSTLIPDPDVRFGLFGVTGVVVGTGQPLPGVRIPRQLFESRGGRRVYTNIPGIIVQDSSGRDHFEPVWTDRLSRGDVDTAIRAIEIYLSVDNGGVNPDVADAARADAHTIEEATGFDITTAEGLQSFLEQYYRHTENFADTDMVANATAMGGEVRRPEFKWSISRDPVSGTNKSLIKAGVTYMNQLARANVNSQGQLNEAFVRILRDEGMGLQSRFKPVNRGNPQRGIRGINSVGPFNEVLWQPTSRTLRVVRHDNYNTRLKGVTSTTLEGRLSVQHEGQTHYVYFAHPQTVLDYDAVTTMDLGPYMVSRTPVTKPSFTAPVTEQYDRRKQSNVGKGINLDEEGPEVLEENVEAEVVNTNGFVGGREVTIANLTQLLNFTPVQNRDGRTPAEVYAYLKRQGITHIPENVNPFYTC